MAIQLNANTTAAAVQTFLRGLTCTAKGIGLQQSSRGLIAQVTDAAGAVSNVLRQTVSENRRRSETRATQCEVARVVSAVDSDGGRDATEVVSTMTSLVRS